MTLSCGCHGFLYPAGRYEVCLNFSYHFGKHRIYLTDLRKHNIGYSFICPLTAFIHKGFWVVVLYTILTGGESPGIFTRPSFKIILSQEISIILQQLTNRATRNSKKLNTYLNRYGCVAHALNYILLTRASSLSHLVNRSATMRQGS